MMPSKSQTTRSTRRRLKSKCEHSSVVTEPSAHAVEAQYTRLSASKRAAAQDITAKHVSYHPLSFPTPLVFPEDDIAHSPEYPAQSIQSWAKDRDRNKVTTARRTIYITGPPYFDRDTNFAQPWAFPSTATKHFLPSFQQVVDYVRTFYHPLRVIWLPSVLKFVSWSKADTVALEAGLSPQQTVRVGIQTPSEILGIRARCGPLRDFGWQLNLNDLLDVAIALLPADAYAMLMIVNQDLYEDENDKFVCGRAYGGSRVAIVSTARYNPGLDDFIGLDLDHAWPLSHCGQFVESQATGKQKRKRKADTKAEEPERALGEENTDTPLMKAISAALEFRNSNTEQDSARWIGRVCRTASHELGHCFGIDHCMYYACCMQGSASLGEDHRQPPYLCPVDLAKVLKATGVSEEEHLRAMLKFCRKLQHTELFVAYGAWLEGRLNEIARDGVTAVQLNHRRRRDRACISKEAVT